MKSRLHPRPVLWPISDPSILPLCCMPRIYEHGCNARQVWPIYRETSCNDLLQADHLHAGLWPEVRFVTRPGHGRIRFRCGLHERPLSCCGTARISAASPHGDSASARSAIGRCLLWARSRHSMKTAQRPLRGRSCNLHNRESGYSSLAGDGKRLLRLEPSVPGGRYYCHRNNRT